ncbi:3-dehydroquinate synthase [Georgenia sp. 10Sc9-8]|uniref:3-dehydroquinate synthase n=1 Tax=Georgenia halotolerans TaxID=3028317 RepID=A0ABT5U208_9MICO|nr:3-dehydroquinate synthase [Georgenia halotolerans]
MPSPDRCVTVPGDPGYDVVIGHDLDPVVDRMLGTDARRVLLVHPPALRGRAGSLATRLRDQGREVVPVVVPEAEEAKTLEVLQRCWDVLGEHRFGRQDAVVGLGGGATTDLAGFVAATWLRGVRVVQVPTTLLGMVDAAVGGKTGINTAAGKNLVGSFHAPAGVVCDLTTLRTLPTADLRAGLAEVVKCGFIADPGILPLLTELDPASDRVHEPGATVLAELVGRAVAVKARVVGEDLRESGLREILNYGHTLGHAIERTEGYRWRHGDAVAVGMVYVAELARLAGLLDPSVVDQHRRLLRSLGLPTRYRADRWPELLDAMRNDKKVRADALRFVVLTDVARPTILTDPAPDLLTEAYRTISGPDAGTVGG